MKAKNRGDSCAAPVYLCGPNSQLGEDLMSVHSFATIEFVAALLQFNAELIALSQ